MCFQNFHSLSLAGGSHLLHRNLLLLSHPQPLQQHFSSLPLSFNAYFRGRSLLQRPQNRCGARIRSCPLGQGRRWLSSRPLMQAWSTSLDLVREYLRNGQWHNSDTTSTWAVCHRTSVSSARILCRSVQSTPSMDAVGLCVPPGDPTGGRGHKSGLSQ